ncbi:hypothetical protein CTheo_1153 [Ceratobasidium theobromae]|uniref:Uncharacterized protein n=1 Tax=Ceratobasidium theobromae TaxID=1582974 RepID=A0A5N5QWC9_9AGAM|nr:hypothetical protein CTheo_1153 [Ceratobasidium theobromae]
MLLLLRFCLQPEDQSVGRALSPGPSITRRYRLAPPASDPPLKQFGSQSDPKPTINTRCIPPTRTRHSSLSTPLCTVYEDEQGAEEERRPTHGDPPHTRPLKKTFGKVLGARARGTDSSSRMDSMSRSKRATFMPLGFRGQAQGDCRGKVPPPIRRPSTGWFEHKSKPIDCV